MKKLLLLLLPVLALLFIIASPVQAQSDENTDSASEESDVQKLQDRLKKAQDEAKVKGVTTDEKKAFIATVTRVSEASITVNTRRGTQIITIDDDVSVIQDGKGFKVSNIEIDSQVVIMGYQKGEDFTPRRILVLKKPLQTVKKTIWVGTVKKIDKLSITLTTRSGEEKVFSLAAKPIIEDNSGAILKIADIEADQDILLVTIPEDSNTQSIKDSAGKITRVHSLGIVETTPNPKEKKVTPTVTPKGSTKTSLTPTKTPTP